LFECDVHRSQYRGRNHSRYRSNYERGKPHYYWDNYDSRDDWPKQGYNECIRVVFFAEVFRKCCSV